MRPPTLSVCFTIHERPYEVLRAVKYSLDKQKWQPDQVVIVLDRSSTTTTQEVKHLWDGRAEIVEIVGEGGWRGPATAWNAGLARVTSEITFMLSSETTQGPENLRLARDILGTKPCVLFGKATDSSGTQQVTGFPPGYLCSAQWPRPIGFVWAVPTWALRAIGGYDEGFMAGLCYDDDDISYRLWKLGLPFVFHDGVTGLHHAHDRPGLSGPEGREKMAINRRYIREKYEEDDLPEPREQPLTALNNKGLIMEYRHPGRDYAFTIWEQPPAEKARRRFRL